MKKIIVIHVLLVVISFGLKAQFTVGIYGGTQYNYLKETKTIYHPRGHSIYYLYLKPSYGLVAGLQAQKVLWDYLVVSNETGYSLLNYEKNMGSFSEEKGELLSHHFVNSGLLAGIKPFARSEYYIKGVEVKAGIFLNYFLSSEMEKQLYVYPKMNYSTKFALSYIINHFGVQLYMTRQLNTFHENLNPNIVKWDYSLRAYGVKVSYDLF